MTPTVWIHREDRAGRKGDGVAIGGHCCPGLPTALGIGATFTRRYSVACPRHPLHGDAQDASRNAILPFLEAHR